MIDVQGALANVVYIQTSGCNLPDSQYLATAVLVANPNGNVLDSISNFVTLFPFSKTFAADHQLQPPTGDLVTWMNKQNWRLRYSQGGFLRLTCDTPGK